MLPAAAVLFLAALNAAASGAAADGLPEFNQDLGRFLQRTSAGAPAIVSVPVPAASPAPGEGFYALQMVGNDKLSKAWDATGNIHFTFPSSCSGFYVSRNYFLTALHCLRNCRAESGQGFASPSAGHLYMNMSPDSQRPEEFHCREASLGLGSDTAEKISAQVIASGSGAAITRAVNFLSFSDVQFEELQRIRAFQSDWALLKISRPSEDFVCVRTEELKEKEKVWGIGFPASAQRRHHSSDGRQKYITAGELSQNGFYGNAWLKQAKLNDGIVRLLGDFYSDRMHWVTSDAYTGMSGGGIFDSEGRALGVYAVLMVDGELSGAGASSAYFPGSNGYLKMSHIINEARSLLGEEKTREAFSCINP